MNNRLRPLLELTRARTLEMLREPGILFWIFGFPVLMAVLLGLAFRDQPVQRVSVGVIDEGAGAAWVVDALTSEEGFTAKPLSQSAADEALRMAEVDLVVSAEGVDGHGRAQAFAYRFDPTRPSSRSARLAVDDLLQRAAGRTDAAAVRDERVSEPGSRYIDFLIPGLIGMNLMGSSMWGVGFVIVLMRIRKILKRFAATPMRRSDYLLGVMLSRLVFLVLEVVFLMTFGWLVFDVRIHGSIAAVAALSLLGSLSFCGVALLVASRPRSIEVASGWMNAIMIPMWMCSGSFFPYAGFPEVLHPVIRALPLTALNDALRSVVNEGDPLWASWSEILVLVAWGGVCFVIALRVFRWK